MRSPVVVVVMCSVALAGSAPSDIDKLVRQHLMALAAHRPDDKLGVTKDVIAFPLSRDKEYGGPSIAGEMFWSMPSTATFTIGKPIVGVNDKAGVAWFQTSYAESLKPIDDMGTGDGGYEGKARFGGIAIREGSTWKLAAVIYARHLRTDKELFEVGTETVPGLVERTETVPGLVERTETVPGLVEGSLPRQLSWPNGQKPYRG